MKLFSCATILLFALSSFSASQGLQLTGPNAKALYTALDQALAEAGLSEPPTPGMSLVSADAIACTLDIIQQSRHCSITAEAQTLEVSSSAADLMAALTNAGARINTSETVQQILAHQVHCSLGESPMGEQYNCSLE